MKKLTLEEARKRFTDCGCVPLFDEYMNNRQKLHYIAGICGHHDECTMFSFVYRSLKGYCSKCVKELQKEKNKSRSIDTEDKFIERLTKAGLADYYVRGTFKGYEEKADFICQGCGRHYEKIAIAAIHKGIWCKECSKMKAIAHRGGPTRLKTVDEVAEMVNSKNKIFHLDKEAYSGGTHIPTKIYCDECDGFHMLPVNAIMNRKNPGCPLSARQRLHKARILTVHKWFDAEKALEWIRTNLHAVVLDKIDNTTPHKNKIRVRCLSCGRIWTSTLQSLYRYGHGCGCHKKIAETTAVDEFSKRFKDSIREYRIKIGKSTYRLDALDPVAKVAFEFDGAQHFEVVKPWGNNLERNRKNDRIKEKWCEENGICLIRVDGRPFSSHPRARENELREAVRRAMDLAVPPVQMLLAI